MSISKLHRYRKELSFGLQISEGQFKPWGRSITLRNSYVDFQYLIEKSSRYFSKDYAYKLIRLLGSEKFALKIFPY